MTPSLTIDPADGSVYIEDCSLALSKGVGKAEVSAALAQFYHSSADYKNGYEWLRFQGVSFGGQPCGFAVCFHFGALTEIHIGVSLPNAELEGGWPTRRTIDQEVVFMRAELAKQLSRSFQHGRECFSWGEAWSTFDPKGFFASTGVRYET
jgi:hypothetical protein